MSAHYVQDERIAAAFLLHETHNRDMRLPPNTVTYRPLIRRTILISANCRLKEIS